MTRHISRKVRKGYIVRKDLKKTLRAISSLRALREKKVESQMQKAKSIKS